jgi:hypothetical protein
MATEAAKSKIKQPYLVRAWLMVESRRASRNVHKRQNMRGSLTL